MREKNIFGEVQGFKKKETDQTYDLERKYSQDCGNDLLHFLYKPL